ncbi:Ppx/GppA phosphatase family protein [Nitrospina gracilis]|uniref:Ppx/GppA phosphatase family protein n=1 Tax=Nitrospina gracilis TaxID=35801 RepID=UPI001F199257|nr:Ppx/GppA phosphatase family protein [Nitrospina gracilis]MCF8721600.1 exopolyphosphatase/guanosine-5'-triphosphate,3'-diphosphate pyrophosphatase [Nitrospina gracilis Nb-211]
MNHFASVDIGSNTIRLLIMQANGQGEFREVASERAITRLGEGIHTEKKLLPHRIDLALNTLRGFQERCRQYGEVPMKLVATSAVREAANKDEFVNRAKDELGLTIDVIPWEEEARLTLAGVFWKLPEDDRPMVTFDIGGGSTEFIFSRGRKVEAVAGTSLGVVRLTERFLTQHPVVENEYRPLRAFLAEELADVSRKLGSPKPEVLVGTAGTVTTLAAMRDDIFPYDPERIHGMHLPLADVERLNDELKAKSIEERRNIRTLETGREDLIIAGTAILLETMHTFACETLTVSEYSLREGVLIDAFGGRAGAS